MIYPPGPPLKTDDEIWDALTKRIGEIVGVRTIQSEKGGDVPPLPYLTVSLLGTRAVRENPRDIDYSPEYDPDEVPDTSGEYAPVTASPCIDTEWHFSVFAYGTGLVTGLLRPLRSAFELSQIVEPVYPYLAVNDMSQIRRLPDFVNSQWRERAQCDIFLHGVTLDGFVIDTINATSLNVNRL